MADKTIWDYPTLATADPNDLILMASDEETYNMKVETLKNAMGEAASKPPIVRNGNWWVWSATQNDYVDSGTAATGPQGPTGDTGAAAGFGTISATVDSNTGTPSVGITTSVPNTAKNIAFEFHNIKGTKGDTGNTGAAAGFGTVTATVDDTTGTPSVEITTSGPNTAKNIAFAFHNMKGAPGSVTGVKGNAESTYRSGDVNITKANIGLGNVDNTSDADKPVSTAQSAAIALKLDKTNVYNALDKTVEGFALDARQGKTLNDKVSTVQSELAIIVDGDNAAATINPNKCAYLKNNTHGLTEGVYINTNVAAFPTGGGTAADSTYFTPVSGGALNGIVDLIYPVGSIYMSVASTSPALLFGGTWEQIKDTFLLSAGDSYNNGDTGGEATHILTESELPSHNHSIPALSGSTNKTGSHSHVQRVPASATGGNLIGFNAAFSTGSGASGTSGNTGSAGDHQHTVTTNASTTGAVGSGTAHNNMPPYLVVNVWKRTA